MYSPICAGVDQLLILGINSSHMKNVRNPYNTMAILTPTIGLMSLFLTQRTNGSLDPIAHIITAFFLAKLQASTLCLVHHKVLVGGFNPIEKYYSSQIGNLPQGPG